MTKTSPQQPTAHDEGEQEGDGAKGCEQLCSVGSVGFSNGSKDFGLGEVATSRQQDIPGVGQFQALEDVKNHEEDDGKSAECPQHQQPRFVSESCGNKGDGQREPKDEQEGLQSRTVKDQVQLRVSVKRQRHQERGQQHGQEQSAERRGVATAEHVQGHLKGVGKEQDRGTHNEPFPTEGDDTEGNTGEHSVGHGSLTVLSNVTVGTKERHRVRRRRFGDAHGTCILHGPKPIHEPDRDEQHHEGVVVCKCPCGMGHVSGHEGNQPRSEDACALAKVVLCHAGNGEDGQCTVNGGKAEHAPPNGVLGVFEEGFEHHGADGHGP